MLDSEQKVLFVGILAYELDCVNILFMKTNRSPEQTTGAEVHAAPARTGMRRRPACGRQVRHWRQQRGLTLAQVAERSGLNVGYLSQIENDKASPSLESLATLGAALDVPMTWFLIDSTPPPKVVRAGERRHWLGPGEVRIDEVDGGIPRSVRIVMATCEPGQRTGVHAHMGEEHHIVVSGRMRATQGSFVADLGAGDYLVWDAAMPHDAQCIGSDPAVTLIISHSPHGPDSGADLAPPWQTVPEA
jgi:transcriptional regulator with XRE-family HTH domain